MDQVLPPLGGVASNPWEVREASIHIGQVGIFAGGFEVSRGDARGSQGCAFVNFLPSLDVVFGRDPGEGSGHWLARQQLYPCIVLEPQIGVVVHSLGWGEGAIKDVLHHWGHGGVPEVMY